MKLYSRDPNNAGRGPRVLRRASKFLVLLILTLALSYAVLLFNPSLLFSHRTEHGQCVVYSDERIDENITFVLDDAIARISRSDFYREDMQFDIFLCNTSWRFFIFSQGNLNAGGVTLYHLTGDVFIRACDIADNAIIPPSGWTFALDDRPLSYFFAHEMAHEMEAQYTGRLAFDTPVWLTEGYADYIGKSDDFDFAAYLKLLRDDSPEMEPSRGLYKVHHLKVAYLIDRKNLTIQELYANPPDEKALDQELRKLPLQE